MKTTRGAKSGTRRKVQASAAKTARASNAGTKLSSKPLRVTHRINGDTAFIAIAPVGPGEVTKQVPLKMRGVKGTITLDFNSAGRLLGMEISEASQVLPESVLASPPRA